MGINDIPNTPGLAFICDDKGNWTWRYDKGSCPERRGFFSFDSCANDFIEWLAES